MISSCIHKQQRCMVYTYYIMIFNSCHRTKFICWCCVTYNDILFLNFILKKYEFLEYGGGSFTRIIAPIINIQGVTCLFYFYDKYINKNHRNLLLKSKNLTLAQILSFQDHHLKHFRPDSIRHLNFTCLLFTNVNN